MKKSIILITLLIVCGFYMHINAQSVGINNETPDASAVLDVKSTNKGLLIPRLTKVKRLTIQSPAEGLLVFDIDDEAFWYFQQGWKKISDTSKNVWLKEGTNNAAEVGDTSIYFIGNIGIGKDTSDAKLAVFSERQSAVKIEQQSKNVIVSRGIHIEMQDSSAYQQLGIQTELKGSAHSRFGHLVISNFNDSTTNSVYGNWVDLSNSSQISDSIERTLVGYLNKSYSYQNTIQIGVRNILDGPSFGRQRGILNEMKGGGDGQKIGTYNYFNFASNGKGEHIGTKNVVRGEGRLIGTYHEFPSNNDSTIMGLYNEISGSSLNGIHYGVFSELKSSGSGKHYGAFNKISGSGSSKQYGTYNLIDNTGSNSHYGTLNELEGTSTGPQYGSYQSIFNSGSGLHSGSWNSIGGTGDGSHIGTYNQLNSSGSGTNSGTRNSMSGNGNGIHYGEFTSLSGSGSGTHYGNSIRLSGAGTGTQYGNHVEISNSGDAEHFGSFTEIDNSGDGKHYGAYNLLSGSGTEKQYGTYNKIEHDGPNFHYGTVNSMDGGGNGNQYGTFQVITNTGSGDHIGAQNSLGGNGSGDQIGVSSSISNSGDGNHSGSSIELSGSGSGEHHGSDHYLTGLGSGVQIGAAQKIDNEGNATHVGVSNTISGIGTGSHYGMNNILIGTGSGNQYGSRNYISNGGPGIKTGIENALVNDSDATQYGTNNLVSSFGNGDYYGSRNIVNGTGNGQRVAGYFHASGTGVNNKYAAIFNAGHVVMNESSGAYDFRVESNDNKNMLFVDGSANRIGVGTVTPEVELDVVGTQQITRNSSSSSPHLILEENDPDDWSRVTFRNSLTNTTNYWSLSGRVYDSNASSNMNMFYKDYGNVLTAQGDGDVLIGERLGINTVNSEPAAALQVNSNAGDDALRIQTDNVTKMRLYDDGHISLGGNYDSGTPNDVFIVHQLGMGVVSPVYRIDIQDSGTASLGKARANAWVTYSDQRVKKKVKNIRYGLKEILSLRPVVYNHHSSKFNKNGLEVLDNHAQNIGFIAQEVYEIIEEVVQKPADEKSDLWSMDYEKLTPVLVKAIQELNDEKQTMQERLDSQQKMIDQLHKKQEESNQQMSEIKKAIGL